MGNKIFLLHILIGVLTLCIAAPTDDVESSTSTSVSVSTVTRKVTSKSVSRFHHTEPAPNATEKTVVVKEEMSISVPKVLVENKQNPSEEGEEVSKPQKIKKKILASNLKNISEKIVLPSDKHEKQNLLKSVVNITEGAGEEAPEGEGGKPNLSSSAEDDIMEDVFIKSENGTELSEVQINKNSSESDYKKRKDSAGLIEGRSLEDRSSEENVNVNSKAKTKIPFSTTERTTSGYVYETFGKLQKVLNNNFLNNNEGYEHRAASRLARPSPAVILPTRKSTPISRDNALKNAIRFESEYFGPSGQTDWVPVVPDKLPVRSPSSGESEFGNKLKPVPVEKSNKTNIIVFPSDGVQPHKESNAIHVRETEVKKTTTRHRNSVIEKQSQDSNGAAEAKSTSTQQPPKLLTKFRGSVKYKPTQSNSTVDDKTFQNETILKRSNFSLEVPDMEIPATGASWTLATLGGPAPTKATQKPIQEETTEISVVSVLSSTNRTIKTQDAVVSGLAVPPENVKIGNFTKEQKEVVKNLIPDNNIGHTTSSAPKHNKTEVTSSLFKVIKENIGLTSMKAIKNVESRNESNVVIPGSFDTNQSNRSVSQLEILKAWTVEVETTSVDVTTEDEATTESQSEVTILDKMLNATTENPVLLDVSSQLSINKNSNADKLMELPVTVTEMDDDKSAVTEEVLTTTLVKATIIPATEVVAVPTTLRSGSFEEDAEDVEMSTEVEQSTLKNLTPVKIVTNTTGRPALDVVTMTTRGGLLSTSTTTPMPPTAIENTTTTTTTTSTTTPTTSTTTFSTVYPKTSTVSFNFKNSTTTTLTPVLKKGNTTVPPTSTTVRNTATMKPDVLISRIMNKTTTTTTTTTTLRPKVTETPAATSTTTFTTLTTPVTTLSTTTSTTVKTSTTSTTTTTAATTKNHETNSETTEGGIYYKNYVPTTTNPHDDITEENVPAYLRLTVQAASWEELCELKDDLRGSIIKMLGGKNVSSESVHFLNLNDRSCHEKIEEARRDATNGTIFLPVNMFLMDKNGDFDKNLSEAFLTLWGRKGLDFELPIRKVDFVTPIVNLTELADSPLGGSVVAAIVISCVAGICVILLGILFVIMKRRQKRFNYGQRCTPVSLDAYSLDSVSIYNSVRRKGIRASKRSYGNAAFDDPEVPTHPMNFAGLANFSSDKEQLYEEFNIIPQVSPKVEELPAGAETKNRYANIIPLPETRVHLSVKDEDSLSDYINANYVRGLKGAEKLYIACQAPMESTVEDFWRMIWEQQCKVILMLTDLQENGIEKCADYLPPNEVTDNLRLFGDFQVTLKKRDVKEKYIISNLKLKNMEANLWREVTHLWYLGWPDQGVPSEANSLIAFLIEARSQMKIQNGATTQSPAVVHCSPGTGRTGTVIACDLCIREYEQTRMVDIPKCVFNIRRDRAGAVQTKDQYAFIYQVLNVYATKLSGGGIESI